MTTRVATVEVTGVTQAETQMVGRVRSSSGADSADGFSIPHEPVLSPEEFNAKIVEALTMFDPLAEGESLLLLGGAVSVG